MGMPALPFLTSYDPPASSEGTLDPLGLYQIADQLAVRLVPAIRERMQRIRFLTPMTIGAVVTDGLDSNPRHPESPPFLVWEWLVVEAFERAFSPDERTWGVPGSLVARRAIGEYGYLDYRSYLKTPRIFGFHGIYKRLAIHLELLDVHLGPRSPRSEELIQAWARDRGIDRFTPDHTLFGKWRTGVERSLAESPVRTRPGWSGADWAELADALAPHRVGRREKRFLAQLLHSADNTALGAFAPIWELQADFPDNDAYAEEHLHKRLRTRAPAYAELLDAIQEYEAFARVLQDAFDVLRAESGRRDAAGFQVTDIAQDPDFRRCADGLQQRYARALERLGSLSLAEQGQFQQRFERFGEHLPPGELALQLCEHHEQIQRHKSAEGKRPWFDRLGPDRIYLRQAYRIDRPEVQLHRYVHEYRGWPIRRFYYDLQ